MYRLIAYIAMKIKFFKTEVAFVNFRTLFFAMFMTCIGFSGCDENNDDDPENGNEEVDNIVSVTGVVLDETSITTNVDGSITLTATILPDNASDKGITWKSSDLSIATVNDGIVTGIAPGKATIAVITKDGNITAECEVSIEGKDLNLVVTNTQEWEEALAAIRYEWCNRSHIIEVRGEVAVPGMGSVTASNGFGSNNTNITVLLRGDGKLYLNSNGSIITIGNEHNLIIDSKVLTLEGKNDNNRSVLYVQNGGVLELNNVIISNNVISVNGHGSGGVHNSGTFTMTGGAIRDNIGRGGFSAGCVCNYYGTFTMTGGTIINNTGVDRGGGVSNLFGTFIMTGGEINDNTGGTEGGGVYIRSGDLDGIATFTMSGGKISGNTVIVNSNWSQFADGGGVSNDGVFTMTGGEISYNSTEIRWLSSGGGVRNGNDIRSSTFIMSGGVIKGNTSVWGGGVYTRTNFIGANLNHFIKSGNSIIYGSDEGTNSNSASTSGHAVYWERWLYVGEQGSNHSLFRNATVGEDEDISTNNISIPPWNQ